MTSGPVFVQVLEGEEQSKKIENLWAVLTHKKPILEQ